MRDVRRDALLIKATRLLKARDGDGDGFVHDGTPRQRPATPKIRVPRASTQPVARRKRSNRWNKATEDDKEQFRERHGRKIPPAWTEVIIYGNDKGTPESGAIVKGRDSVGKLQTWYTAEAKNASDADKFERISKLHTQLSEVVPEYDANLVQESESDPVAAVTLVLKRTGMRPGSTKDLKAQVQAYGATTLESRHVKVSRGMVTWDFIGKKGVRQQGRSTDPDIVAVFRAAKRGKAPEERLFPTVTPEKINAKMREDIPLPDGYSTKRGGGFTGKDWRTYLATAMTVAMVQGSTTKPKTKKEFRQMRKAVADIVAAQLGNTSEESLKSYINPAAFSEWEAELS